MTGRNLPALIAETPLQPQQPALVVFGRDDGGKPRAAWFAAADAEAATAAAALMKLRTLPLVADEHRALAKQLAPGRVFASGRAFTPYVRKDLYRRLVEIAGGTAGLSVAVSLPAPTEPEVAALLADHSSDTEPSAKEVPPLHPEETWDEWPVTRREPIIPMTAAKPTAPTATPGALPRPGEGSFVGSPQPGDRSEIGLGSVVLALEGPEEGWWEAEVIGINGRVFSLRWRDYPTQPTILRKAGELALLPPGEA